MREHDSAAFPLGAWAVSQHLARDAGDGVGIVLRGDLIGSGGRLDRRRAPYHLVMQCLQLAVVARQDVGDLAARDLAQRRLGNACALCNLRLGKTTLDERGNEVFGFHRHIPSRLLCQSLRNMQAGLNPGMARPSESLGHRLARARKARGMSQTELADKAGLKQSDVSKLETGKMLKTTGMARLSRALRVPDLWLELGEGPEPNFHGVEEPVPQYEGRPMSLAEAAGEFGSMTVSRYDRELLDDFAELLPEDQARIRGEIAERATQMRKHAEYVLKKAGVTAPAPAHRVSHIPSAPAPNPTRVQSPLKTFATKKHRDVK